MKEISVTLGAEEAIFSWREGKVYCEGYDLENEKAVLALTTFGEGIGVLLVAMNISCSTEAEFISEVEMFLSGYDKVLSDQYNEWPEGQLLFEYFSYHPAPNIRWGGMDGARLSERHYKGMLSDPEMGIKVLMARLPQLPEKYSHSLASLSNSEVNYFLARKPNCPIDILDILAKDKDEDVRRCVAGNPACPQGTLEILGADKEGWVRMYVSRNPSCPQILLEGLSRDDDKNVRLGVAQNPSCPERIVEILAKDNMSWVRDAAQERLASKKGWER